MSAPNLFTDVAAAFQAFGQLAEPVRSTFHVCYGHGRCGYCGLTAAYVHITRCQYTNCVHVRNWAKAHYGVSDRFLDGVVNGWDENVSLEVDCADYKAGVKLGRDAYAAVVAARRPASPSTLSKVP
jgi:hypothetical protein